MPHRVTNFLRNSSNSLEAQVSNLKKAATAKRASSPSAATNGGGRRSPQRAFSYASSIEDDVDRSSTTHNHNMATTQHAKLAAMEDGSNSSSSKKHHEGGAHHDSLGHRLSLGLHFGRSSKEAHVNPSAALRMKIESPPLVMYGSADDSTGALMSGQMFLDIKEDRVEMESFTATLQIHVTQKRPFTVHCHDCINQYTEIQKWDLLKAPLVMSKGEHAFPISVLLPGHLPASLDGPLVSIAYEFRAEAVPKAGAGAPVKYERTLDVKRALPAPELPHHSVRVFPPTNIKASVHFPQVIHPVGASTLALRMDGLSKVNAKNGTVEYWRLKKLTWRLEEHAKTVAPACDRHTPKDPKDKDDSAATDSPPPAKRGMQRSETRAIGEKTLFSGWKSDYSRTGHEDSSVEIDLEYGLGKAAKASGKFACDTKSRDGSEVTHQLMVEMVVSQEWAPLSRPGLVTQTGVGRILRMHFATVLTERAGIGISWDNEAPPIYQDVPPSPPGYVEELRGSIEEAIDPLDAVNGDYSRPGSRAGTPASVRADEPAPSYDSLP